MLKRAPLRRVEVTDAARAAREAEYAAWAVARGLVAQAGRRSGFLGALPRCAVELTTGLREGFAPDSPELTLWTALAGSEEPLILTRETTHVHALAPLLAIEGVRDIAVTARFVRVSFDPFVKVVVFTDALGAFEEILRAIEPPAAASPYR